MSLKEVLKNLNFLDELTSTNAKKEELAYMCDNELFVKVCKYALDPRKKYKIKTLPKFTPQSPMLKSSINDIFNTLDMFAEQNGVSKRDKEQLAFYASIDKETWEVVSRICKGDLRCGVGVRTLNSVYSDMIPFTPYLRCSSKKKINRIKTPCLCQEKANGMYAEMQVSDDDIIFGSRDSHEILQLDHLKELFRNKCGDFTGVLMGELRCHEEDGTIMSRQKGNGIVSQCIQGTASYDDAERIFFTIWDCVPLYEYENCQDNTSCYTRFKNAMKVIQDMDSYYFQPIPYQIFNSINEAQKYANDIIKRGGEGAVAKNMNAIWKHGTSTDQVKLKARFEADLRVLDWEYGDKGKKHEHRMGRILVGTDDGLVRTWVGMGFSDKLREENWDDHIDRIVEVDYESASKSKSRNSDIYALYGPAGFVRFRDNKKDTDTLQDILER